MMVFFKKGELSANARYPMEAQTDGSRLVEVANDRCAGNPEHTARFTDAQRGTMRDQSACHEGPGYTSCCLGN